jgi:threonylcarbamoyladenosine tRNA methylthiotransferase MtaB
MLSDIHIFPFSLHSKTPAANLKNVVSETEKKNRYLAISKLNEKNKKAYLNTMLNKTVEVLFEKSKDASFQCGHSQYFFKVYVQSKNDLSNTIKKVKLIKIYKDGVLGKLF